MSARSRAFPWWGQPWQRPPFPDRRMPRAPFEASFCDIEGVTFDARPGPLSWNEIAGQWPWETPRDWRLARIRRKHVASWSEAVGVLSPESYREPAADAPREGDGLDWVSHMVNAPTFSCSIPIKLLGDGGFGEPDTRTFMERLRDHSADDAEQARVYWSRLFRDFGMPVHLL